MIGTIER
jgi:hypothetical protein